MSLFQSSKVILISSFPLLGRLWTRLVKEAGSSGSLYTWMQSFLQDHFYSAIKVDPMVSS